MNNLILFLNWILNWMVFDRYSMFEWIIKIYRPGLHPMQANDTSGSQLQITKIQITFTVTILLPQSQEGLNSALGLQEWRWCSFKDWFRPMSLLANDYCHFVFPTGLVNTSSKFISTEYASPSSIIILCFYEPCHDRPPNHSTFWSRLGRN